MKTMKAIRSVAVAMAAALVSVAVYAAETDKTANKAASTTEKTEAGEKQYKPLAEARAKIGDIIAEPAMMTEVLRELSPEDQKTFVADVNAAIAKLPGSTEDKSAKYLNVNKAALKGAAGGNMANILAVTFASVPPESLVVISERYAADLFNRDAAQANKVSDPVYEQTAREVVGKVVKETSGSDDAGVRNTLAVLMFVRAANDSMPELANTLVEMFPDSHTRELAKKEWVPDALAKEGGQSYDGMLAYADAGKAPNLEIVINLAGPQILDAMLVDITSSMDNYKGVQTTPVLDQAFGGFDEAAVMARNDTTSATAKMNGANETARSPANVPWNPEYKRGDPVIPEPGPEPYPFNEL